MSAKAVSFASNITVNNKFADIEIPLSDLKTNSFLLLPRPYPAFQPLWFTSSSLKAFDLNNSDKLQISFAPEVSNDNIPQSIEVESVFLKK